jgi:hypothetical protein
VKNGRLTEEALRDALAHRIERTSLRDVAEEVGLTHGGLRKFLSGSQPRASTMAKLLAWYSSFGDQVESTLTAAQGHALLEALLRDHPPAKRALATVQILEVLEQSWGSDVTKPAWLRRLSRELRREADASNERAE